MMMILTFCYFFVVGKERQSKFQVNNEKTSKDEMQKFLNIISQKRFFKSCQGNVRYVVSLSGFFVHAM